MTGGDQETRVGQGEGMNIRLWLRLLTCTNLIEATIRRRLRDRYDITLPRFDAMAQLYRAPEGLQMSDLSRRMMVSNGNVTGVIDRLMEERHVAARPDPTDRRRQIVSLTAAGRAAFEAMLPDHEAWVDEIMGGLTAAQSADLYHLLAVLKASAGGSHA